MTLGLFVLLVGLFVVPAILLATGHRLRRRSARWRSSFWGAVKAHIVAGVVATIVSMLPPVEWRGDDFWRGLLGLWLLLLAPVVGALVGLARGAASNDEDVPGRD